MAFFSLKDFSLVEETKTYVHEIVEKKLKSVKPCDADFKYKIEG